MKKNLSLFIASTLALHATSDTDKLQGETSRPDLVGHYLIQNGYGVTLSGSALFWKTYEDGLEYVIRNQGTSGINQNGEVEHASFDWDWGFRTCLGYQIPGSRKMDLQAEWTRFITDGSVSHAVTLPTALFSIWSIPLGGGIPPLSYETQASASSHLSLNAIDLKLGTTFSPRPFLDLTPFIDLETAWIRQKFDFHLSGGPGLNGHTTSDDHIEMKNHFWGIGPKIGIDTLWILGQGFGLFGNFNCAILYGFFHISQNETATFAGLSPPTVYLDVESQHALASINMDLALGLRWDRLIYQDRYHIELEAGWEALVFLEQNQLMRFSSQTNYGIHTSNQGDLTMQGLTLRAGFTF